MASNFKKRKEIVNSEYMDLTQTKCILLLLSLFVGNRSKRGKWGSAPTPVGSEVGSQDPRPWIGSPVGNQACIVPRPL